MIGAIFVFNSNITLYIKLISINGACYSACYSLYIMILFMFIQKKAVITGLLVSDRDFMQVFHRHPISIAYIPLQRKNIHVGSLCLLRPPMRNFALEISWYSKMLKFALVPIRNTPNSNFTFHVVLISFAFASISTRYNLQ